MILQLIGLPSSGKTYVLNKIKSKHSNVKIFDLASYSTACKENLLLKDLSFIKKQSNFIIVESACGLKEIPSIVILLRVSNKTRIDNQKIRKDFLSKADSHRLIDQMLPSNYTVYNTNSCETLIKTIIKSEFPYDANSNFTC